MKTFNVIPKDSDSVTEINTWLLELDEHKLIATQELNWGSGEFALHIPETPEKIEDIKNYVNRNSREKGIFREIPEEHIAKLDTNEYFFEMVATSGGAHEDWSVGLHEGESNDDIVSMIAEAEEGIESEGDEFLYENGWEEDCYDYKIEGGIKITPLVEL